MKTALRAIGYSLAIAGASFAFLAALIGACVGITEAALAVGLPLVYASGAPLVLFIVGSSIFCGIVVARSNKESCDAVA